MTHPPIGDLQWTWLQLSTSIGSSESFKLEDLEMSWALCNDFSGRSYHDQLCPSCRWKRRGESHSQSDKGPNIFLCGLCRLKGDLTIPQFFYLIILKLFQVENTLFRIHKSHLLRHSWYLNISSLLWGTNSFTETNPFVVSDITVEEFRHFLRITLPFVTEDL
jgi:hypothetical protein